MRGFAFAMLLLPAPATAQSPDPARLRQTVATLVGFGTRHTLSSATDPKRGIGAARSWIAAEFRRLGLTVERPSRRFSGPRAPAGVVVEDVLGLLPGREPNDVVIVAGHIDSRVTDVMNAAGDAPGANDDGSGVALVLEAARLLAGRPHRATIVFAVLSGEEQGLWGGQLLADLAKQRGWRVLAMLNNDIVGNTVGTDGRVVADRVRVFSEGIPASADLPALKRLRQVGGEDDTPSRALAKRVGEVAALARATRERQLAAGPDDAMAAVDRAASDTLVTLLVRRPDRFGRGGDHLPFLDAGFPAVRFTSAVENYDAQHQDLRTENGRRYGDTLDRMDFGYLAKVTDLNVAVLGQLADAPPPPDQVVLDGAVSSDTRVSWTPVRGAVAYRILVRSADPLVDARRPWSSTLWTTAATVRAPATSVRLEHVVVDDNFIGVAALGADGEESLVTFGGLK